MPTKRLHSKSKETGVQVFKPKFRITPKITTDLLRIEGAREALEHVHITPLMMKKLRETAKLQSTHYSTQIEGNRLSLEEAEAVVRRRKHILGRERDEKEVLGYFHALEEIEGWVNSHRPIDEISIQQIHGIVMGGARKASKSSPYRKGQNVIRELATGRIVYLPPEAKDVSQLMKALVQWINHSKELPAPLISGIAHYQFATIHPYFDGNGRTARLLTTWILHHSGYGLKGFYSLEEYYAKKLRQYYEALSIGPLHNYYEGRAGSDITPWIEYFCEGMAESFETIKRHAQESKGAHTREQIKKLRPRERQALTLFVDQDQITSSDVERLFQISGRAARKICQDWVKEGFFKIENPSKKARRYSLVEPVEV